MVIKSVLADRLSSNPANRIVLIEAGGEDDHPLIRMPAGGAKLATDSRFNWDYYTQKQRHLGGRKLYWPRGRVLGGSSSINAMCYVRGQAADYDGWTNGRRCIHHAEHREWQYQRANDYDCRARGRFSSAPSDHPTRR